MRDDLHRSVPPRTPWARVLRLLGKKADDDELRAATTSAVRIDTAWVNTQWGKRFESALDCGGDLFPQESIRAELKDLMRTCPSLHARTTCEIALGQLARDGGANADFKSKVLDRSMRVQAADSVELLASRIATQFDSMQAAMARRKLMAVMATCDLTKDPPMRARRANVSIESDLDTALELTA